MTPVLLAPLGLAALAGLLVPLLVHLRRRDETVPVEFAALRWLGARPRPRRRVRITDWPLLVVRLLLVALLALLLARPAAFGLAAPRQAVLVAPGVDPGPVARAAGPDADLRWLAPGFPAATGAAPAGPLPLSSLVRQFDAELPAAAPLTVVVPAVVEGVDAGPLRLTRRVRWQVVAGAMPRTARAAAGPPALTVVGGAGLAYLRAAATAWRVPLATGDGTALPAPPRVLAWLRPGPVPARVGAWVAGGGTALLAADAGLAMPGTTAPLWSDADGAALVEGAPLGRGRLLRFTRPLEPAAFPALLDPAFPTRLAAALATPAPPPARAFAADVAPAAGTRRYPLPPVELDDWLAIGIAALFALERWLATARRRAA